MATGTDPHGAVVLDLVGKIYEAAATPELWPQFLDAFANATNSDGTVIWLHDTDSRSARVLEVDPSFVRNVRMDPAYLESYAAHYTYVNTLLDTLHSVSEGTVVTSNSVTNAAQFHRTEYYCDWLRPQGVEDVLGGPVLKRGSTVAIFSASRGRPYEERERRLLGVLMPHLRRACLLHRRLTRLASERAGALAALDLLPTAVWLFDACGILLFANRAGVELDRQHDGLWIDHDGSPAVADPAMQDALRRNVSEAIAAGRGRSTSCSGVLRIRRRRSAGPLQVMVYPVPADTLAHGSAAAVFIFDPECDRSPDVNGLRLLFGLTRTEAQLAAALSRGDSLDDYCSATGVTTNTARTHLKRVLEKTGTHRQAQLVSVLARTAASYRPPR